MYPDMKMCLQGNVWRGFAAARCWRVSYKKVFPFKIASNHHLLSPGGFICVLCCTTGVSAMPLAFVARTTLAAVIAEEDFLALCNSRSLLCSANGFKEETLNLHRR